MGFILDNHLSDIVFAPNRVSNTQGNVTHLKLEIRIHKSDFKEGLNKRKAATTTAKTNQCIIKHKYEIIAIRIH